LAMISRFDCGMGPPCRAGCGGLDQGDIIDKAYPAENCSAVSWPGVNEHDVVSTREPTQGRPPTDPTVRTYCVLVLEPGLHQAAAIGGDLVGTLIRPIRGGRSY
jgi:hypothetical protein